MNDVLLTAVGDNLIAIDVKQVSHVIRKPMVTPLPGAPDFIEGVLVYRNHVVPVVMLQKRLELESAGSPGRVFLVELDDMLLGLRVDRIVDVISIACCVENPPDSPGEVVATFMVDDHPAVVMDPLHMLTDEEKRILHAIY